MTATAMQLSPYDVMSFLSQKAKVMEIRMPILGQPIYEEGQVFYITEEWRCITSWNKGPVLGKGCEIAYEAGGDNILFEEILAVPSINGSWLSAKEMPCGISRLSLRVASIKAERLHDITYDAMCNSGLMEEILEHLGDKIAITGQRELPDGFGSWFDDKKEEWIRDKATADYIRQCHDYEVFQRGYKEIWDKYHAADGLGYDTNPWVWVFVLKPFSE